MEKKDQAIEEEYLSSLVDLNVNSKPLINMLTILADENIEHASVIVHAVEQHLVKVNADVKLPILYLIDSIVKNVGRDYTTLFSHCLVNLFCGVFEKVNEKVREKMFQLRQTWNDVFPPAKLYTLDVKVNRMDPNWPITAKVATKSPAIHVNPNFFKNKVPEPLSEMQAQLREKQRELLELQKRKVELELVATKKRIEEEEKKINKQTASVKATNLPQVNSNENSTKDLTEAQINEVSKAQNMYNPQTVSLMNRARIAPVNSALVSSVRLRDPRLARQQHQAQNISGVQVAMPGTLLHQQQILLQQQQQQNHKFAEDKVNSGENDNLNKNILQMPLTINNNKRGDLNSASVRILNLNNTNKDNNAKFNSTSRSVTNRQSSSIKGVSGNKTNSTSSNSKSKSSNTKGRSTSSTSKNSSSKSNSTKDITKSSSNSSSHHSNSKRKTYQKRSSSSPVRERRHSVDKSPKHADKLSGSSPGSSSPATGKITKFKDIKGSTKSRNYMRHNRSEGSVSPTATIVVPPPPASLGLELTNNVDLRNLPSIGSPDMGNRNQYTDKMKSPNTRIGEKSDHSIIKLNTTDVEQKSILEAVSSNKDVDLRQLPTTNNSSGISPTGIKSTTGVDISVVNQIELGKKRVSGNNTAITIDKDEPITKKSKSEKIDISLFGNEDVDLRTLNLAIKPLQDIKNNTNEQLTPPPPPIISDEKESTGWAKLKGETPKKSQNDHSNFDAVRAKLAEAARNKDKLSKSILYSNAPGEQNIRKRKIKQADTDLRNIQVVDDTSQDGADANIKIIMEQAQEQLDNESIDLDQYNNLVKQVIQINETNKIHEAQRRESLRLRSNQQSQDLTPISDEEVGFSSAESDDELDCIVRKPIAKKRFRIELSGANDIKLNDVKKADVENSINTLTTPLQIESSFAASTAADLRNMSMKDWKPQVDPRRRQWEGSSSHWNPRVPSTTPFNSSKRVLPSPWQTPITGISTGNMYDNTIPPPTLTSGFNRFSVGNSRFQPNLLNINNIQSTTTTDASSPLSLGEINSDDTMRTINIDSVPRELRFYDDIPVAFMNWDEPKEIGFQMGQRRLTIDDKESFILNFNDKPKPITIDGKTYQFRLGSPTRELYIDNKWYECFFGEPPIRVNLDGNVHVIKVEGPAPQVKIGNLRTDLVVGKINLIIDARIMIPVFLDSKPQVFEIDSQIHTLQFADYLMTVLINGETFSVEYGGLPKSYFVRGKKHFIRFTALPSGIMPGKVYIKNMMRTAANRDLISPTPPILLQSPFVITPDLSLSSNNSNINNEQHKQIVSNEILHNPSLPAVSSNSSLPSSMEFLSNLLPSQIASMASTGSVSSTYTDYQIEPSDRTDDLSVVNSQSKVTNSVPLLNNINIDELYQKLLATGILGSNKLTGGDKANEDKKVKEKERIQPVSLTQPETIRTRQSAIVYQIYSGMQCSSCGVRFPPEQTIKYSQHLDWHFRQNRRDRDSARRAHSRKWYYDVSDWIQYEEIEDLEEREKNWFETQQSEIDLPGEDSNQTGDLPLPSCPAGTEDVVKTCDMCHDSFEQFYNEETEEWHLKQAIRVENKTYHPVCYEDYKSSLLFEETVNASVLESEDADNKIDTEDVDDDDDDPITIKREKTEMNTTENKEKTEEDGDDDVIEVAIEAPVITEILDDEDDTEVENDVEKEDDPMETTALQENASCSDNNDNEIKSKDISCEESDVEIQEPHIPITDLDDIEDKPYNENDENSQMSHSSFMVKIKEEPKDDGYDLEEDDAFEDVGTIEVIPIDNVPEEYEPSGTNDTFNTPGAPEGNLDGQETVSQTISTTTTNRIKINITKPNAVAQPLITTVPNVIGSIITTITTTAGGIIKNSSENPNGDDISDKCADGGDNSNNNNIDVIINKDKNDELNEDNIIYELKPDLINVQLKKMPRYKNGSETSGLCSIM